MTIRTIDCVECGEAVSYGRLSCPACGALLASVAGGQARSTGKARPVAAADDAPAADAPAADAAAMMTIADSTGDRRASSALADDLEPDVALNQIELSLDGPAGSSDAADDIEPAPDPIEPPAESPEPGAELPSPVRTPFDGPEPILVARSYGHRLEAAAADGPGSSPVSGYRPPALALSTATSGGPSWPSTSMSVAARSSIAATGSTEGDEPTTTSDTSRASRLAEIGTWFVIVGAAMAVLGFLLPWSSVVIGARGQGGYLDSWGLASPTHVVVLLATLVILGLGILRTTVPVWLWAGVLALALGGLLVGLTWPYQVGPLGADVGVIAVALGGLALVIGGIVTSWATRHVEVEPTV